MKKLLFFTLIMTFSAYCFAASDVEVCSQLINLTDNRLDYLVHGKAHSLDRNENSDIYALPDPSKYQLLDGEITVYAGGVQITEDGSFNLQYENGPIPEKMNCVVFYKLRIYN